LKAALDERELTLQGITTDGSALYPEPLREVFGEVPHQLCTFHVIKDLTQGVLRAVASERALGHVQAKSAARPTIVQRQSGSLLRASEQIDATENQ
jgi:hypothetical protein